MENIDPKWTSLCPRCGKEVSNRAYFSGPKGSAHFRGTCSPPQRSPYFLTAQDFETIAERDARKHPYPMPPMPNYEATNCKGHHYTHVDSCYIWPRISTYADLAKWWGLDKPVKSKPIRTKKETAAQWIKAHPEIAYANKQSRAVKTLARMGLTA